MNRFFKTTSFLFIFGITIFMGCGSGKANDKENTEKTASQPDNATAKTQSAFNADSAYSYVATQVAFGPRVPNTAAHKKAGEWLEAELRRHGAAVTVQTADLKAFDGTILKSKNIFGQYRPELSDRILLLAHWDCRPWADEDPDEAKRKLPVDGANDGASGVGVLLEIARMLKDASPSKGVDILFVDAEDWGNEGDNESWALGTKYFIENSPVENYNPSAAILLDMVGGEGAVFCREYFSEKNSPQLNGELWAIARDLGYGEMFTDRMGTAVVDDHVQLISRGIPSIDIIEYNPESEKGFNERWHTTSDTMEGISKTTLKAVGQTLASFLGL